MLTDREVLSTLNMLRNEHLDVRTVTLGISLFDCASHDFDVFAYRVRAVTKGDFVVPPLRAEALYDPRLNATGAASRMVVE